jgi:hypothetical protein
MMIWFHHSIDFKKMSSKGVSMYQKRIIADFKETPYIKPQETLDYEFAIEDWQFINENDFKIMLKGEYALHSSWMTEGGYPYLYRLIDDCLCPTDTHHSQFCLHLKLNNEPYRKRAYYKIIKQEHSRNHFNFSIYVKAKELKKLNHGNLEFVCEKRFIKEGVNKASISADPDEVITIPIPEGNYNWQKIEQNIFLEDNVASILVYMNILECSGELFLEDPCFRGFYYSEPDYNYLPQFCLSDPFHEDMNWFGENLSKKDWANLKININSKTCFEGEFFQRCLKFTELEFEIDRSLLKKGINTISITNQADYFMPHPYRIKSVYLLHKKDKNLTVVGYNDCVPLHTEAPILIYLKKASHVTIHSDADMIYEKEYSFNKGFHVIHLTPRTHQTNVAILLQCDDEQETVYIKRTIEKQFDNVLTGTSDAIYLPQNIDEFSDFFAWYIHNGLGNFITLRPAYRWSGTRELNKEFWDYFVNIFNDYQLHFCHIIDGRELPGINANPKKEMLESKYFVGNQGHERDGAFYYWGTLRGERFSFFDELFERFLDKIENGKYITPPIYEQNRMFANYNPIKPKDMEEAAVQFVENVKYSLDGVKRHSGPSTLFKYFYEAGLESAGSELMYGPHEVILAAQRGAAIAYNKTDLLAHLAVQWSTLPHDTKERFRRYQLSLFLCYTHNVNHINTEEGLWHLESELAYYDRFSDACLGHLKVQKEFAHFVNVHTRAKRMVVPFAFLHGKNDAWACFGRGSAWGLTGEKWEFNDMERSWDLLKVFYPDSVLDAIYKYPCENKPQGFYTRTPYSAVDILPIEADKTIYSNYKVLAFLGFNTATSEQFEKLYDYCNKGGILILSWCHMFTTKNREEALAFSSSFIDKDIIEELLGIRCFEASTNNSKKMLNISLSSSVEVVKYFDEKPLIIKNSVGKGQVVFVNSMLYPSNPNIKEDYETVLKLTAEEISKQEYEKGYIVSEDTVNFTIFEREDKLRVIYLINTDWWSDNDIAKATLKWKNQSFEIDVVREKINIITLSQNAGVITRDFDTEVLFIEEHEDTIVVKLQGNGQTTVEALSTKKEEKTFDINGFTLFEV